MGSRAQPQIPESNGDLRKEPSKFWRFLHFFLPKITPYLGINFSQKHDFNLLQSVFCAPKAYVQGYMPSFSPLPVATPLPALGNFSINKLSYLL